MNWNEITRFNFTYAISGGAWLEDASGERAWVSFSEITAHMGAEWLQRQHAKQGTFTGCWIDVAK
jgi:hypothetical protein